MDMDTLPPFVGTAIEYFYQGLDIAQGWLLSPAAWSQFAVLVVSYVLAVFMTRFTQPRIEKTSDAPG